MRAGLILFLVALLVRGVAVLVAGFDGLYGQDAFAYYDQAVAIANAIPRAELPPSNFFWPNGYPAMAALVMWLVGQRPAAAQLVSLVSGAALAPLTYVLCRDLFPQAPARAGIVAASIVAAAGQAVMSSVVVMADMPALFWSALAAWLSVRAWRRPHGSFELTASGAALAMAIVTRWFSGVLLPVLLVYGFRRRRDTREWVRRIAPAVVVGALIVLLQITLSAGRPEGLVHSWLTGWRPLNAFRSSFETVDGFASYRLPVGAYYLLPAFHPAYLLPPLALFTLWGTVLAWRARAHDPLELLLGWALASYAFLAGIPYQNLRFGLSLWLPLVVFAGAGASDLWARHGWWRSLTSAVVALALTAMLAWSGRSVALLVGTQHVRNEIVRAVERRLPPNATLVTFGLTLAARHYTDLDVVEIFEQNSATLAALVRRPALYLLLDTTSAETQWRGRAPAVNYHWLLEHTRVTRIAEYAPYTLFELAPP